ncbi:MAG: BcpO-related WXXGXW repeat protein, partial [Kofleriaceae bacterium]|nr:BcpO-related WXXGXW repeat protein [Kofleriaceae bacterium]
WSRVDGDWEDSNGPGPGNGPTSAPPPPRPETPGAKAGFVWVEGQWDWKDNKWDWVAGHWERERAGKRWRQSRWEQRDGRWSRVDGDWEDANAPSLPPNGNPGPIPPHLPPRHEWKLERPVVSSYWPIKGKTGTKVVIRGKNFPKDASVVFAGQPVNGAKVNANQIVFVIPANATTGAISLRAGGRRELAVGNFEVAAAFDPIAEQKRLEEERQKAAQAAWEARQAKLAKDRAAREAAMRQREQEREATRDQRRAQRIAELAAKWQRAFLADEDTQDELTLHAQRIADIERMREIADLTANAKLAVRIEVALSRETMRHDQRMVALESSFKARGGTP